MLSHNLPEIKIRFINIKPLFILAAILNLSSCKVFVEEALVSEDQAENPWGDFSVVVYKQTIYQKGIENPDFAVGILPDNTLITEHGLLRARHSKLLSEVIGHQTYLASISTKYLFKNGDKPTNAIKAEYSVFAIVMDSKRHIQIAIPDLCGEDAQDFEQIEHAYANCLTAEYDQTRASCERDNPDREKNKYHKYAYDECMQFAKFDYYPDYIFLEGYYRSQ